MDIRELMDKMAENISVRRVFGTAYEREGALIVPVAMVAGGGGGGEGPVKTPTSAQDPALGTAGTEGGALEAGQASQPPTGSGGGFGGVIMPVGVYVVKDDQVRFVPAYNVTMMVLAGLGVVRVLARLVSRRLRRA